jgi:D-sedoheptulose 7-phosphate isomerase
MTSAAKTMREPNPEGSAACREALLRRNGIFDACFRNHSARLAAACQEMARRFLDGGRLMAFGRGAAATDAEHVAVEFVHPVIVGKRALPAMDLGREFEARLRATLRQPDIVMGFSFPGEDPDIEHALGVARERGALTLGLRAEAAEYSFPLPDADPFVCQEAYELLYHLLWETVHVFFEHREQGHDVGATAFLYPFLGTRQQPLGGVVEEVQQSMLQKVAELNGMRTAAAETQAGKIEQTAVAMVERLERGGKIITAGNGGSATDANDLAIDCVAPPVGPDGRNFRSVAALSLAAEPATLTAIANDIGAEAIFVRQLIAHARPEDIAIVISTSGGSANLLAALREARKRGLLTVALVGYDGGRIVGEGLADQALIVSSDYIPRIQEVQASIYHVLRTRLGELMDAGPGLA